MVCCNTFYLYQKLLCTFLSIKGVFQCTVLQYAPMWICMPVLNSLISIFVVLFHPHVFVLWLCSFFDAALPLSSACPLHLICSDLIWPPSAREHSADPSGKVCTLDLQCNPSPVSSCPTVPSHQGCTIPAKMTLCYTLVDIFLHFFVYLNIFIGIYMIGCATLRLPPSHSIHLTTTKLVWPQL